MQRRTFLALSVFATGCEKEKAQGFPGYAFIANEEGQAIAVVDLNAFAVARHIHIGGKPSAVIAHPERPSIYALTGDNGTVHEIGADSLKLARKLTVASRAREMRLSPDGQTLWVLAAEPRQLVAVSLADFKVRGAAQLPAEPNGFDIERDGKWLAVSFGAAKKFAFVDATTGKLGKTVEAGGELSSVLFRSDGKMVMVANAGEQLFSLYETGSGKLVTHLPLSMKPEHICVKGDGGQVFVAGPGAEAVAVVYPYRTEVAETILAGHQPGAMASATAKDYDYLFVANPTGDVTIVNLETRKMAAVIAVGKDPGYVAITPDQAYALVLNRGSGDMAVIRMKSLLKKRARSAPKPLFTMVPVGSRPVSAAVRAV